MLKPKAVQATTPYWEKMSDDQLLALDMTTDSPDTLPDLVLEYPEGDDEPYVEYSYDLRGTDREQFRCVHGNHHHLKGFVFRKGAFRYLVGWQCGDKLYGQKFDQYTSDFNTALSRRDALCRVRDLREAVALFARWADDVASSPAVQQFDQIGKSLEKMPSVVDVLTGQIQLTDTEVRLPQSLVRGVQDDLEGEVRRLMNETSRVATSLTGPVERVGASIRAIRQDVDGLIRRAERIVQRLEAVELLFQPVVLCAICEAIDNAVPQRRRHFPGLLKITTRDVVLQMPKGFKVPSRNAIDNLTKVAAG